jgi:hypothetical protein
VVAKVLIGASLGFWGTAVASGFRRSGRDAWRPTRLRLWLGCCAALAASGAGAGQKQLVALLGDASGQTGPNTSGRVGRSHDRADAGEGEWVQAASRGRGKLTSGTHSSVAQAAEG